MPQDFTDRCIFPDHDPRDDREVPTDDCQHCGDDFPRAELNARGYCARCAQLHDPDDRNYDPSPLEHSSWDDAEWPFAENH